MIDREALARAARKVSGVAAGVLADDRTGFAAAGTLAGETDPGGLCWEIGSITKVFTGVLLADMSIAGEVDLDDPIGRFVPDEVAARLPDPGRQPTLADLATHTSGLPRLPLAMVRAVGKSSDPYARLTLDDVWSHLGPKTRRPSRPRPRYSNYGMGLLAHLLERAAGGGYGDLVRDRILDPLGMTATGLGECPGSGEPVVGFRKGEPTPPWSFGALAGAGGLRSTAADLLRFAAAVVDPPGGRMGEALALSGGVHFRGRMQRRGLGWDHRVVPPGRRRSALWHNGGTYGAASFLAVDRDGGTAVVAFGNRGPVLASPIDRLGWALFDALG